MSIQEVLQILGGIGAIASIIFAGLQVRRNTITMRASANHNINLFFANMYFDLAKSPDFVDIALRSGEDFDNMTRVDKARARFQLMGFMRVYENAYLQHDLGILKSQDWAASVGDLRGFLERPDVPKIWALVKNRSGAKFCTFVEKLMDEVAADKLVAAERLSEG